MSFADKACHNCRRKRLRCDRSVPQCVKCSTAGRQCLGYGNLLRWTGAVASRGRLAGQTSFAPPPAALPGAGQPPRPFAGSSPVAEWTYSGQTSALAVALPAAAPRPEDAAFSYDARMQLVARLASDDGGDDDGDVEAELSSPWVLTDPLYQDMNYSSRHYLNYFTNRLCKDLVSYDLPNRNPFRLLIPLTRENPLLRQIIIAASAVHLSNLISPSLPPSQTSGQIVCPLNLEPSRAAVRDSMVAKHKALNLMSVALQDINSMPGEVLLAAALFFVNLELIESGKHGWRAHLEGAGRIMSLLQLTKVSSNDLLDYLLSDFFCYSILASAFSPAKTGAAIAESWSSVDPSVLRRAASNSYLCCPPEILEVLRAASQLSNLTTEDSASAEQVPLAAAELIQTAQAFEIVEWANSFNETPDFPCALIQSRIHAGSAHRLAACLYILHAVPAVESLMEPGFGDGLSDALFEHLSCIPEEDPNFKATAWPTFIAGAGTVNLERRAWVMDRLHRVVVSVPWGFIYTAMEVLPIVWGLNGDRETSNSWVQMLKDPELNFLMV
ncbi:hypothetical protein S40285_08789 [Stachybotrys chlorohalonatus IBT 40285]|uniref:Zn(2)-C6 fungal-type domain-containing protein n=1 Tax=Stachybotrys chlorohalonatus (strain IBT 40285) TaxID=1283841 RepID=A0A084QCD3_STAC4|nr:hypothetical protein S40285_08789 [Stachybotrys chlorohalonata IBT 40285]